MQYKGVVYATRSDDHIFSLDRTRHSDAPQIGTAVCLGARGSLGYPPSESREPPWKSPEPILCGAYICVTY